MARRSARRLVVPFEVTQVDRGSRMRPATTTMPGPTCRFPDHLAEPHALPHARRPAAPSIRNNRRSVSAEAIETRSAPGAPDPRPRQLGGPFQHNEVPQRTPAAPSWNARMTSRTGPRSLPASQTSVPDSWQPAAKGTSSGARSAGAATTPIVHPSPGAGHHRHHQRRPDRSRPPVSNPSSTTVRTTLPSNSSTVRPMTTTDFLDGQARGRASMLVRLHPIGRPESGPARAHVGVVRNPPSAFRKRPGWAG